MTAILTSLGLILGIGFLLDYKKPHCVEAECATVNPVLPIIEYNEKIRDYGGDGDSEYIFLGATHDNNSARRRVCFLNYVYMRDVEDGASWAKCNLYEDGTFGKWKLQAVGEREDVEVECSASCLCWPESDTDTWCEDTDRDP